MTHTSHETFSQPSQRICRQIDVPGEVGTGKVGRTVPSKPEIMRVHNGLRSWAKDHQPQPARTVGTGWFKTGGGFGRLLDPAFDPNPTIHRNVGELVSQRMMKQTTLGSLFRALLEMKEFIGSLPSRLNRIMVAITSQELQVKFKAVYAKPVIEGFQKVANRITTGIALISLIFGACLLMRFGSSFRLFGYPGRASLCFWLAAAGGFCFLYLHE